MIPFYLILLALVVYTYIGYPAIIVLISKVYQKKRKINLDYRPTVTWVVPSYNEQDIIADKINNILALEYPADKLDIIIITDGSSDDTPKIAATFERVRVLHEDARNGKSAAENRAMKFVSSEVVVFNDANTIVSSNALLDMVKHYYDPVVGGVSGAKGILTQSDDTVESKGEGLYWKYESAIKTADSKVNSLMGAAGELVSFRSKLVKDLPLDTILDDFMQTFYILQQDHDMLYEPKAKAEETSSASIEEELKRKVRIAAGGWQSMARLPFMLNVFKRPVQAWMYVSHRVLRWSITAFALPILLLVNALLYGQNPILDVLLLGQVAFYSIALIGHLNRTKQLPGPVMAIYYFCVMNYAVIAGFKRFLANSQNASWERSKRK